MHVLAEEDEAGDRGGRRDRDGERSRDRERARDHDRDRGRDRDSSSRRHRSRSRDRSYRSSRDDDRERSSRRDRDYSNGHDRDRRDSRAAMPLPPPKLDAPEMGGVYRGRVSSVMEFGCFVELDCFKRKVGWLMRCFFGVGD